ncbi:hypothetical protein PFBG_05140 [Plasmodium falciparum 7G8]|uniref:Uncharacterized protein n=8 Tax=Plasmodium falciparum TaxID=5833 RepID=Q8ILY4_PLAF7|nr:conserved Plasmodium membrane protein, unknown function [Plasmodium falciparum 3D7]ETW16472.1 hypothetical protein PFFVO_04728 [Plasmodium falciparum Vietnam Oak-Knoll (FVO)]ETW34221.1 hypothetical protein PFTANZ_05072 [Plasmodium falciparum Tanzania (2000708)]ETW40262.1 hypothetical protein PFNF135_05305 [Plasmodium falciparum NF135/5.C10]ETW59029.1 hypothetical protein PFMC_05076 [Plasmodium falciparum CAMP/Malaysia]EUR64903.1 hypothetical protein PFBG_05140 [Plasmodium falciparum 7G8]EW|eukprot:XP_001348282.2 conserved Plasmodium membrane protein, unknown function [Plasmodium falciparum 3D7]
MFIIKSNIQSDNTLDNSAKKEHNKINKFLISLIVIINVLSLLFTIILAINFYYCSFNVTSFLFLTTQTCLWTYLAILNVYDQKYIFSLSSFLGIHLYTQCYQNYDKLFLSDELQEYHFMSVALSHLPFLYICYDIVIFQYDSVFIKSTLDYTYNEKSLIVLNFLRGLFCSFCIAVIFIISLILNIQNTFRTFPMLKLSNIKTKKYLLSVFLFYLIDSQLRIITFLFIIETYEVNPFKIFVFIFSQIMTICVCIAFDTHIFKNIIVGISSILVSPLSIILHSTNRNYSNERVVRLSKLLINFRFFEFFLILFYGSLYYDDDEIGNTFILYLQLISLILLFFLIIVYKKVLSYKRKFEENMDDFNVDMYNNINDN